MSARRASPTANKSSANETALESRLLLAAKVIVAPASYEFRDMGFDPATQEVGIVGYEGTGTIGVTKIAKLFEINEAGNGFTAQTLVGLGPGTQVFGISSDAYRIAGVSKSPGSIGAGEGTTWIRVAPNGPVGIGYLGLPFVSSTSTAVSAWHDGVVGEASGAQAAMFWTQSTGIVALEGHENGLAEAKDVSSGGAVIVGFSTHEVFDGAAYYWDSTGIHRLPDSVTNATMVQSVAYSISPSGRYIGGYVLHLNDETDNSYQNAAVWNADRELILLTDASGNPFEGTVLDVSNHGYAVGTTVDGRGFIWHPSFDGVQSPFTGAQYFEDWLAATPGGTTLSFASKGVEAIAEDPVDGQLLFALSDYEAPGASAFVEVDVAGIADARIVTSAVHQGKLPENVVSTGIATLEVGLRGSVTLDVTKLDRASLFIGDDRNTTSGRVSSVKIKDVDGDGFKDAIITLKSTGTLRPDTVRLKITGQLTDGTRIDGSRTVTSTTQSVNAYWQATTGTEWRSMLSAYNRGLKKTWW